MYVCIIDLIIIIIYCFICFGSLLLTFSLLHYLCPATYLLGTFSVSELFTLLDSSRHTIKISRHKGSRDVHFDWSYWCYKLSSLNNIYKSVDHDQHAYYVYSKRYYAKKKILS